MGSIRQQKGDAKLESSKEMFSKVSEYVRSDLHATSEDYKLMEKLNLVTADKFKELTQRAVDIQDSMGELQNKSKELQPYLDQIDVLDGSVSELANTASLLDDYSRRLESRYKDLVASRRV